jgi:hypothetical protein
MQEGKHSASSISGPARWRSLKGLMASQQGMALIVAVITLVVLTVIGIAALTSTDVELKVARGEKAFNIALYNAEASISVTGEVLEEAIARRGLPAGAYKGSAEIQVNDGGFWGEQMVYDKTNIQAAYPSPPFAPNRNWASWPRDYYNDQTGNAQYNSDPSNDEDSANVDLTLNLPLGSGGNVQANVDVDYLGFETLPGGSMLMAMGYEGVGKGLAGGGAKRIYGFACRGNGPVSGTRVRVYVTYDHIL